MRAENKLPPNLNLISINPAATVTAPPSLTPAATATAPPNLNLISIIPAANATAPLNLTPVATVTAPPNLNLISITSAATAIAPPNCRRTPCPVPCPLGLCPTTGWVGGRVGGTDTF